MNILITQCLQKDFVKPIGKYDKLPNRLHLGYREALRLMGEDPANSPVRRMIRWAYAMKPENLGIIHIRDWHDGCSLLQKGHLEQFGEHCLKDSEGAEFVFEEDMRPRAKAYIVNASGLNDFVDTDLEEILIALSASGEPVSVGIMGVWTEAKVFFLAYDLITRFPHFRVGLCSALTASSSRAMHFVFLDQLKKILGVKIFPSLGEFTSFLGGHPPEGEAVPLSPALEIQFQEDYALSAGDLEILRYLYRGCRKIEIKGLAGGYSGNVVLKVRALDHLGQKQVANVVKIGPARLIGQERMAFEKIQEVMGNNAPGITDYVEIRERGGIKYRYASMIDEQVTTFQNLFATDPSPEIFHFLDIVFKNHLGRLYEAGVRETLDLLEYYDFRPRYAPFIKKNIQAMEGLCFKEEKIEILPGVEVDHPAGFYEKDLAVYEPPFGEQHKMAFVHGDLNGQNIIIDGQANVWLIDFFHTHRGHILRDLVKLENDLLFVMTRISSERELEEALRLTDLTVDIQDLAAEFPGEPPFSSSLLCLAYEGVKKLRSFYPALIGSDRDPYQFHVALLRYAMHTLSFDEANSFQKRWALYAGALCINRIRTYLEAPDRLRIDFLPRDALPFEGRLGLTILPGRKDRNRDLSRDLGIMSKEKIRRVVCLVTEGELEYYGVPRLPATYVHEGFKAYHFPIIDQMPPESPEKVIPLLEWIKEGLEQKENVMIHCVGGLGRSGVLAAAFLRRYGLLSGEDAVTLVRQVRGPRAVETRDQEEFIKEGKFLSPGR